jgi:hypothetical protein
MTEMMRADALTHESEGVKIAIRNLNFYYGSGKQAAWCSL